MAGCGLIVHADDFGLTKSVNLGIVQSFRKGIVTSTSLMANGAAFDQAVELAKAHPGLDVGVHLTLTEEQPVLDVRDVSSLAPADGRFYADIVKFGKAYLSNRIHLEEVERELGAQIRKVQKRGLVVTHLDGHQHVHMFPGIRDRVGALAKTYGIPAIRYPLERPALYMFSKLKAAPRVAQMVALNVACMMSRKDGAIAADRFFGFFHGGKMTRESLLEVVALLPSEGTCELMCHPGMSSNDSRYKHWGYCWAAELDALMDPQVRLALKDKNVRLISYADLSDKKAGQ